MNLTGIYVSPTYSLVRCTVMHFQAGKFWQIFLQILPLVLKLSAKMEGKNGNQNAGFFFVLRCRTTGHFSLYKHLFTGCGGFTAEETLCRAAAIRLIVQIYFSPYLISFGACVEWQRV